jgi:hypothetical protein
VNYYIYLFKKIIERDINTTIMTFIICIVFYLIQISPCFTFVSLRISTDRTAKVVEIILYLLELLKARRYQIDVLNINKIHNQILICLRILSDYRALSRQREVIIPVHFITEFVIFCSE